MRARVVVAVLASLPALALGLAACGDDTTGSTALRVTGAWARTTVAGQTTGAVYFTIHGGSRADELTGVSVPAAIAASAMLHETTGGDAAGSDTAGMDMGDASGDMSSMKELARVKVSAGGTVRFEPGRYHVMLMDLAKPLDRGTTFTIVLRFRDAGPVDVAVTVRDRA